MERTEDYPVGLAKKGKERLANVEQLRSVHWKMSDDDRTSERNRAKIQDLGDYKPPLNSEMLKKSGQKGRFNINFGEYARLLSEAESSYIDGYESPEHLVPIKLNRGVFSEVEQAMHERTMSDEYTKLLRGWDGGYFNYALTVQQFLSQGIGLMFFEDADTWQWTGAGLREFKFPRKTKAHCDAVEICTSEGQIGLARLSNIIEDEEAAKEAGWNVEVVRAAVEGANTDDLYDYENAEDLQEKAKANDFDEEEDTFHPVNVIYSWVKELDGTISFYIGTLRSKTDPNDDDTEPTPDDYLYSKKEAYANFGEAMQIFPYSTGNKGNIYTIRGIGFTVYPQVMASNLMQSAMLDSARDSMSVKYTAPAEREINNIPFVNAGPATFVPHHLNPLKDQFQPDLSKIAIPVLDLLGQQLAAKSSSSSMSSVFNNKQDRRSAEEVGSAMEHFNSLNDGARLLFSRPWRAVLSSSCIRAFNPIQDETSEVGSMALVMQKACVDLGVPPEAFEQIDLHETKTSIPVGAGSKAARSAQFEAGATLYQEMDDVGRANFNKDRAIHHFGVQNAKRYLNFEDKPREIIDERIAILENNDLMEGTWIEPSNSEVSIVHLRVHLQPMEEMIQAVEEGQMELLDFTNKAEVLYKHAEATIQMTAVPEEKADELNMYEQKLQQIGEYLNNGIREREKLQREQAEQEAQGQQQGAEGDPAAEAKVQVEQMKLQVKEAEAQISIERKQTENMLDAEKKSREIAHIDMLHKQKMIQNQEDALQKMQLKDSETAATIKRK